MSHSKSSGRRISSSIPLQTKFSILSLAIEASVSKFIQAEGPDSINAKGIRIAFKEFSKFFNQFVEKHSLFPGNELKLQAASRKLNHQYNHILNGVLEKVNIIPRNESIN